METCNSCGGAVKIIACIEEPGVIEKILTHLDNKAAGDPARRLPPCRAPPQRACSADSRAITRVKPAAATPTEGAAVSLSSRAWKSSKNRAQEQHFCRFRGAIWANTAPKRRFDGPGILAHLREKVVNPSYTHTPDAAHERIGLARRYIGAPLDNGSIAPQGGVPETARIRQQVDNEPVQYMSQYVQLSSRARN
jgi:hypothetical protein